ncbi:MAG: hypothetical protein CL477_03360 [Acidobacteria bacterium]|jgi:hypothetical protein|nr:hypothetical protein [Acidobacteriota bacterium]MDP7478566.1 hypothetical protein [Vicinamibacterales bacterium]MDP7690685.1 hypothetical protein [Vicinamibacterales bacterium]HJN46867.1 hypothetical protein [Vicinamibacterales bacterium]|tara:strand:- start:832 stop:1524 length:693 start_codon:yes stop_codon:yes gene_type:complete
MVKTALRYLLVAILCAGAAVVLLVAARLERRLALADQELAMMNLSRAARAYDEVADSLAATGRIPWLLRGTRDEIAARQAAVRYWRGDYAPLVADYTSPDSPSIADNLDLQFIVANADYRSVQRPDSTPEMALGVLDHAIGVYRRLLEGNEAHLEAAFNYEVMVRLRNRIAAGDEVPEFRRPTAPGNEGDNPEETEMEDIQIYVPSDTVIDPADTEDPTIGAGAPIRKRG